MDMQIGQNLSVFAVALVMRFAMPGGRTFLIIATTLLIGQLLTHFVFFPNRYSDAMWVIGAVLNLGLNFIACLIGVGVGSLIRRKF